MKLVFNTMKQEPLSFSDNLGVQGPGVVGFNVDTKATLPGLREDLITAAAVQVEQGEALYGMMGDARAELTAAEADLKARLEANARLRSETSAPS